MDWSADPNELAGRNVRGRRHREALIAADLAVALEDFGDALRLGLWLVIQRSRRCRASGGTVAGVLSLRTGVPYEAARLRLADVCKPL